MNLSLRPAVASARERPSQAIKKDVYQCACGVQLWYLTADGCVVCVNCRKEVKLK